MKISATPYHTYVYKGVCAFVVDVIEVYFKNIQYHKFLPEFIKFMTIWGVLLILYQIISYDGFIYLCLLFSRCQGNGC